MGHVLHRVDDETVRDFEFRTALADHCPVLVRYGERDLLPAHGNQYAVQFEHPCAMGPKPHDIHAFSVLMTGTDQAFMVLWGKAEAVLAVHEELHESNVAEDRIRG
jgi:hypothetical protein